MSRNQFLLFSKSKHFKKGEIEWIKTRIKKFLTIQYNTNTNIIIVALTP